MDGGGGQHVAVAQQAELGGTTAQIDVKQCVAAPMRQRHRAGAVGGQDALEVVAGRGAHELAA